MTAINILVLKDSVSIITDSLARSAIGPDFHVSKTVPIPHMRLAVATRGPISALDKVARAVSQCAFDFASARSFIAVNYGAMNLNDTEVFAAGWDGDKPSAFVISATNTDSKIVDIPYVTVTPMVSPEEFDAYTDDPIAGMRALLQAQAQASSAVGGVVNVTQVGPAVIEVYTAGIIEPVQQFVEAF